ncbi:MAG: dacB [Amycolatopsis sp.]|nr:dacB [Amycolatopsis sp.]
MRIEPTGELHPAEATTGADRGVPRTRPVPPPDRPVEPEPEPEPEYDPDFADYDPEPVAETHHEEPAPPPPPVKTKRRRKGLLIGSLVALLLVIALGVAAALPQVSNRLGLPWAPNAPKGDEPALVAVTTQLHGPRDSSPEPLAGSVASILKGPAGSSDLGKLTGSVLDATTGTELWDRNAGTALTPASTTKLLTVSAALLSLDHGLQLTTKVVQGSQPGTVILVAGGDMTLNSLPAGKESIYPGSAHFDDLIAQVKKANPSVKKVQLDLSAYVGPTTAPGWDSNDAPSVSATNLVPIMLDGGRNDPTGNDVSRVANPATAAVKAMAQGLGAQSSGMAKAPTGATVLGEVKSAPLTELVDTLLTNSDNNLADTIGRQVAIAKGDEPSYAGAVKATMDVLKENGFDLTGVTLQDNSGLSRSNKIPAKVLSSVLAVIAGPDGKDPRTAKLRPIIAGLPIAAVSGTLSPPRYTKSQNSAGAGWVRAKTGSLSNVNTLAGVVLDTDGRVLVFALMSESSNPDPGPSRDALDTIAATLRGCGCR